MTDDLTAKSLLICTSAKQDIWGVGDLADIADSVALVGWTSAARMGDAGFPDRAATTLATALTRRFVLSFPFHGSETSLPADDRHRVVQAVHIMDVRVETVWRGFRRRCLMVSTMHPRTALKLFDDAYFHWHAQGMAAVLRDTAEGIGGQDLANLVFKRLSVPWTLATRSTLTSVGVRAVLCPGVDGSVAGLLAATPPDRATVIAAIEEVCADQGVPVRHLDEGAFRDALASA